eukprot:SAG31_NODE_14819_length_786_cov_0.732169_1_plen_61_part_10
MLLDVTFGAPRLVMKWLMPVQSGIGTYVYENCAQTNNTYNMVLKSTELVCTAHCQSIGAVG